MSSVEERYNLRFTEGLKYAEDLEFINKCYGCANRIQTLKTIGYNYYLRPNSVMSKAHSFENATLHLDIAKRLIVYFDNNILSKGIYLQSCVEYMFKAYFTFCAKDHSLSLKRFKKAIKNAFKTIDKNTFYNKKLYSMLKNFPISSLFLLKFKILLKQIRQV